jgi:CubicO group peptidase (beta-lactamase class C family)
LRFEPGKGWDYSNAGFVVLGAIIEKASGEGYFSYVKEHIFKPAGMTHTFHDTLHGKSPSLAVAYSFEGGGNERRGNVVGDTGGPAGGGASTVGDLLKFANALLSHKLVNAKSLETMTSFKAKVIYEKDEDYGYGFSLHNVNGHPTFGHSVGFPGVCTQLEVYPKEGYVVVVLSNYDPVMGYRIADKVRRMVAEGRRVPAGGESDKTG